MFVLTRKQAQALLGNPENLPMNMTKRRWEALKAFAESDAEWARDFQPPSLGYRAWEEFCRRLQTTYERRLAQPGQ